MTGTVLDALATHVWKRVEEKKRKLPLAELKRQLRERETSSGLPFGTVLREPGLLVIAEVKKASPSKGVTAEYFPYLEIARTYEAVGASCIPVLTEPKWFLGDDRYSREVVAMVSLPRIRKDFMADPYLIYEAWELDASAMLLICALFGRLELEEYLGIAEELGLSALVGAYDEEEMGRAAEVGAHLIGANNRDSKSFSVNMENNLRPRAAASDNRILIAESGVRTLADTRVLRTVGANGILVGEALIRAENKAELLQALRKGYEEA